MMNNPLVSIVVPNYNHARHLAFRLDSILNQIYQDFEVILLDDASSDDSLKVINDYVSKDRRIRSFCNTLNSGSPFKQWARGIKLARGEYIWIAESDDYADKRFISTLLPKLIQNPKLSIAFCQSYRVDLNNNILYSCIKWSPEKYSQEFYSIGEEEFKNYGIFSHHIYNASAVIFRRSFAINIPSDYQNFRYAGDSLFWNLMLLQGNIYFNPKPLNYFREPENTKTDKKKIAGILTEEYKILKNLKQNKKLAGTEVTFRKKREYLARLWSSEILSLSPFKHINIFLEACSVDPLVAIRLIYFIQRRLIDKISKILNLR